MKHKIAWALTALTILTQSSWSRDFYITTTGVDQNNYTGSQAAPFRTIQKGVDYANPGDTVLVATGTYYERVVFYYKQGSPNAYITIKPQPGAYVRVQNSDYEVFKFDHAAYLQISGFDVSTSYSSGCGFKILDWSHHIRIQENQIHDCGESGISAQNCDYLEARNNTVHDCSKTSIYHGSGISLYNMQWIDSTWPAAHSVIVGNNVYNNSEGPSVSGHTDGNGIIVDTCENSPGVLVQGNTVSGNGGRGIHIFRSSNVQVTNNFVSNNLNDPAIGGGELTSLGHDAYSAASPYMNNNITFTENTVTANGHAWFWVEFSAATYYSSNTVIGNTTLVWR